MNSIFPIVNSFSIDEHMKVNSWFWYPKDAESTQWDYSTANSYNTNCVRLYVPVGDTNNSQWFSSQSVYPFYYVDPKYAVPEYVDHTIVFKITHLRS